jgi:hypothetical protein
VSEQWLIDFARMLLYPALALAWAAVTLLGMIYYFQVLRHWAMHGSILAFGMSAIGYFLLSLVTGLDPILPDPKVILPYLIASRLIEFVGLVVVFLGMRQRIRDKS